MGTGSAIVLSIICWIGGLALFDKIEKYYANKKKRK